jgi:hypothetical protein
MPVKIHGREYATVAERITALHAATKGQYTIVTEIVRWEDAVVVIRATLTIPECGSYTGHSYEKEGSTQINKTSALENCETSAIGRALAAAGYGGSEYASANEVSNAIHQQQNGKSNGHHKPPADPKAEFERMVKDLNVDNKTMRECLDYHQCVDLVSVPESKRREFYKDLALTTQTEEVNA